MSDRHMPSNGFLYWQADAFKRSPSVDMINYLTFHRVHLCWPVWRCCVDIVCGCVYNVVIVGDHDAHVLGGCVLHLGHTCVVYVSCSSNSDQPAQTEIPDSCIWHPRTLSQPLDLDSCLPPTPCHTPCSALHQPCQNVIMILTESCSIQTWWAHLMMIPSMLFFMVMLTSFPLLSLTLISSSAMSLAAPWGKGRRVLPLMWPLIW